MYGLITCAHLFCLVSFVQFLSSIGRFFSSDLLSFMEPAVCLQIVEARLPFENARTVRDI